MVAGIVVIAVYVAVIGVLVLVYERPARRRAKISGRGGDFES